VKVAADNNLTTPTGVVTFIVGSALYSVSLNGSGMATLVFVPFDLGFLTLDVVFNGSTNFFPCMPTSPLLDILNDCHYSGCVPVGCFESECLNGQVECTISTTTAPPGSPCIFNVPADFPLPPPGNHTLLGSCNSSICLVPLLARLGFFRVSVNAVLAFSPYNFVYAATSNLNWASPSILGVDVGFARIDPKNPETILYSSLVTGNATVVYSMTDDYGQVVDGVISITVYDPCLDYSCPNIGDCYTRACSIGSFPTGGPNCTINDTLIVNSQCSVLDANGDVVYGLCESAMCIPIATAPWTSSSLASPQAPAILIFDDVVVNLTADHGESTRINATTFSLVPSPGYVGPIVITYTVQVPDGRFVTGSETVQAVLDPSPKGKDSNLIYLLFLLFIPVLVVGGIWLKKQSAGKKSAPPTGQEGNAVQLGPVKTQKDTLTADVPVFSDA